MKKTILGVVFMSTILMLCLTLSVGATMYVSDPLVEKIKTYEGFTPYPVHDHTQFSVGYGSACGAGEYTNGITEAQAEVLLRKHIAGSESYVNDYITKKGIVLTQQQYDALVSMTYNLGPNWINEKYQVWKLLESGDYTDLEIFEAMSAWRKAGGVVLDGLVYRRTNEAQMFLFGEYGKANIMTDTTFLGNGGTVTVAKRLDCEGYPYTDLPKATRAGYQFAGWYTAPEGGTQVTETTLATGNITLYAHWTDGTIEEPTVTTGFLDVSRDDWFYDFVERAVALGAISGYQDNTYRPKGSVTYGEALKTMMIVVGYPEQPQITPHWASGYEATAQEVGLLEGISYDSLNDPISRLDIAQLAVNLVGPAVISDQDIFVDTQDEAALMTYQSGIFNGQIEDDDSRWFYPDNSITRGEFSKVLLAVYDIVTA